MAELDVIWAVEVFPAFMQYNSEVNIADLGIARQVELFDILLEEAKRSWPDRLRSQAQLEETCHSLVMRPLSCEILQTAMEPLRELFPAEHNCGLIYYEPVSMHMTIFGLPGFVPGGALQRHLERLLMAQTPALRPFTAVVSGLSVIGDALVARCLDKDGKIVRFVNACLDELSEELGDEVLELVRGAELHRSIFWVTLARLRSDLDIAAGRLLLEEVCKRRHIELGVLSFDAISLSLTNGLFSKEKTTDLSRFELGLLA